MKGGGRSQLPGLSHNHGSGKLLQMKGQLRLEGPIFHFNDYGYGRKGKMGPSQNMAMFFLYSEHSGYSSSHIC